MLSAKVSWILNKQRVEINHLPKLIFIINDGNSYSEVITRLPKHKSAVILRMYLHPSRSKIAHKVSQLCKQHNIKLLIAGDPQLALSIKADGLHISENSFSKLKSWRQKMPHWIITAAAHSLKKIYTIKKYNLSAALYSPVFQTASHSHTNNIGIIKFTHTVSKVRFPVYALGGINLANIKQFKNTNIAGLAGITLFNSNPI